LALHSDDLAVFTGRAPAVSLLFFSLLFLPCCRLSLFDGQIKKPTARKEEQREKQQRNGIIYKGKLLSNWLSNQFLNVFKKRESRPVCLFLLSFALINHLSHQKFEVALVTG